MQLAPLQYPRIASFSPQVSPGIELDLETDYLQLDIRADKVVCWFCPLHATCDAIWLAWLMARTMYEEGLREGGAAARRYSTFFLVTGPTVMASQSLC